MPTESTKTTSLRSTLIRTGSSAANAASTAPRSSGAVSRSISPCGTISTTPPGNRRVVIENSTTVPSVGRHAPTPAPVEVGVGDACRESVTTGPYSRQVLVSAFLHLPGVAQLDERLLVGGVTRLDGPPALQLRVELSAQEYRDVRDPQPDEERDDAAQRAVRLVVVVEVGEVEGERGRHDDPEERREDPARRHPAEASVLGVR